MASSKLFHDSAFRRRGGTTAQPSSSSSPNVTILGGRTWMRRRRKDTSTASRASSSSATALSFSSSSSDKVVWIETTNVQVLLSALEVGLTTTALFNRENRELAKKWSKVGRFSALHVGDEGVIYSDANREAPSGKAHACTPSPHIPSPHTPRTLVRAF